MKPRPFIILSEVKDLDPAQAQRLMKAEILRFAQIDTFLWDLWWMGRSPQHFGLLRRFALRNDTDGLEEVDTVDDMDAADRR